MGMRPFDRMTMKELQVLHKTCRQPIVILELTTHSGGLTAYGICETCGRYVRAKLEAKEMK